MLEKAKENGGKAPSERELADHFKISRGHVRETLAALEAMKVIKRRPKSGIYINDDAGGLEKMAFISQLGMPLEVRQVDELVELRKIHENKAAELAASNATEENMLALKQILDESEATLALGGSPHNLDRSFHLEVVRATQSSPFHSLCQLYYQTSNKRLTTYFEMHERGVTSHTEHMQIFDAIARKDGTLAHSLMNAHLTGAPNYWADILRRKRPPHPEVQPDDHPSDSPFSDLGSKHRAKRSCQTKSNQSLFVAESVNLPGTKLAPAGKSGGSCEF